MKIKVDHASSSFKSIISKQIQLEAPQIHTANSKIVEIQKHDKCCEAISTVSTNEFKEVLNNSIQKAAFHSKKVADAVKEQIDNTAIFENDLLNHNLQQSFLPFIDKFGIPLKDLSLRIPEALTKPLEKSSKKQVIYHRNRNASMMNPRQSNIDSKLGGSISRKINDRSYIQSPSFQDHIKFDHFVPKPIKDPRYLKIKSEFKKMLMQSKIDRNSELQKPFRGDSVLFLEESNNFLMNSLSPIFKPKSNCLKKIKNNKQNYNSKLAFKKFKLTDQVKSKSSRHFMKFK